MTRRTLGWIVTLLAVVATTAVILARPATRAGAAGDAAPGAAATSAHDAALIVGPGRVEPISEEIAVSGEVPGRLRAVLVDEGDRVTKGQVLAEVEPAEDPSPAGGGPGRAGHRARRGAAPRQRIADRGAR